MSRWTRRAHDENGAALLLALFFLIGVSLLLGGLVSLSGANLRSTVELNVERSVEYSANTAVEAAIQVVRTTPPSSFTIPACPTIPALITGMNVSCTMGIPSGLYERVVQFTATCTGAYGPGCTSGAVPLTTEVVYNDGISCFTTPGTCSAWGASLTVVNWVVQRSTS